MATFVPVLVENWFPEMIVLKLVRTPRADPPRSTTFVGAPQNIFPTILIVFPDPFDPAKPALLKLLPTMLTSAQFPPDKFMPLAHDSNLDPVIRMSVNAVAKLKKVIPAVP